MTAAPTGEGAHAVPAMRALLALAAVLVLLAGVQLTLFPTRTATHFAWTIASPMTAAFLGASYWSAVGLEVGGALARRWSVARVAVPAVFVFTGLTLVVTLVHLDRFHLAGTLPMTTRAVTWAWIAVYAVVPVLMVLAWVVQRRAGSAADPQAGTDPPAATDHPAGEAAAGHTPVRLPGGTRAVLVTLAVVLVAVGVLLLVVPERAAGAWPWPLTPLTARAVGAWCVGLGVAAGHARLIDDAACLRPVGVTGVLFGLLQGVALLRFGSELTWSSPGAAAYVLAVAGVAGVGARLLVLARGASALEVDDDAGARSPADADA